MSPLIQWHTHSTQSLGMVFDFSLLSPSASYQLLETLEPWFQVFILTATILMNRFHHLIPGVFSPIELCFLSSPFSPPTVWPPNILESCQMTYQYQACQPGSHSPSSFWPFLMCSKSALSQARGLQPFSLLPLVKTTWSSPKTWSPISFTKSFLFPSTHSSSLCIPIVFIISSP